MPAAATAAAAAAAAAAAGKEEEEDPSNPEAKSSATTEAPQKYGFLLDKPWYYRVGLAVACGVVLGVISSVMIMSFRQAPKNSSAYQSLLSLLKENPISRDLLGENVGLRAWMHGRSRARGSWWGRARRTGRTSR